MVIALSGCAGTKNTFVVQDPGSLVSGATLELCGSETPLVRDGNKLSLSRSIRCEGSGEIRLIYKDGGPAHCIVGYVTSDAKQTFVFRAERSRCVPVLERAESGSPL